MAKTKKNKKRQLLYKYCTSFLAGLALPAFLAYAWIAHGQPGAKPGKPYQTASMVLESPSARPDVSPEEEYALMRTLFQQQVQQVVIDRLDRYKRGSSNSPKLQQIMEERRQRLLKIDQAYYEFARRDVLTQMHKAGMEFGASQYFVYADRNPHTQIMLVGFYDAPAGRWSFSGPTSISSGTLEKDGDYFVTPGGGVRKPPGKFQLPRPGHSQSRRMAGPGCQRQSRVGLRLSEEP